MAQNHLVIPGCCEVAHIGSIGARSYRVINHLAIPDGQAVSVALADAVFNAVKGLWNTNIAGHCPDSTSYSALQLRDLRQEGMAIVQSTGPATVGTEATVDPLPPSVAAVLTLRTNRAGKSFRGRSYWCGFSETANDTTGRISAAMKTSLDAFAAGYASAHAQLGCTLGVAHRPTTFDPDTGLPIAPGLGFVTAVTQVIVRDTRWDSQRRRAGRT